MKAISRVLNGGTRSLKHRYLECHDFHAFSCQILRWKIKLFTQKGFKSQAHFKFKYNKTSSHCFCRDHEKINDEYEKTIAARKLYMGDVQGPEEVNDTCIKTLQAEMTDRGFNIFAT
jgi:hypothetical protein